MKYHYQFVSKNSARVELIAEYDSELALIAEAAKIGKASAELLSLFRKGIANYLPGAVESETVFMNFPTVALCKFGQPAVTSEIPGTKGPFEQLSFEL